MNRPKSPMEEALIEEYQEKGLREQVLRIAGYDYKGVHTPTNCNWWQLNDLHMLAITGECEQREYNQ